MIKPEDSLRCKAADSAAKSHTSSSSIIPVLALMEGMLEDGMDCHSL